MTRRLEISPPGTLSCNKGIFAGIVRYVAPHITKVMLINCRPKKVGYYTTITLQTDSERLALVVFIEVTSNDTSGANSAPDRSLFLMIPIQMY